MIHLATPPVPVASLSGDDWLKIPARILGVPRMARTGICTLLFAMLALATLPRPAAYSAILSSAFCSRPAALFHYSRRTCKQRGPFCQQLGPVARTLNPRPAGCEQEHLISCTKHSRCAPFPPASSPRLTEMRATWLAGWEASHASDPFRWHAEGRCPANQPPASIVFLPRPNLTP